MKKKILMGILIAVGCLYLSMRHVNWLEVKTSFQSINWFPFLSLPFVVVLTHYFRSRRWQIFLSPVKSIRLKELFTMNAVGFMTINLFPLRLGEFTRPLLLKKRHGVPFTTGFATVAIERIFDALFTAGCLGVGILGLSKETDESTKIAIRSTGITALILTSTVLAFVILAVVRRIQALKIVAWFVRILPRKLQSRVNEMAHHFFDGLAALPNFKTFFQIMIESLGVWFVMVIANFFAFRAFGLDLPWSAMFTVLGIATLGTSIPGAPGSVGTMQLAVQLALSLYGVSKSVGFAYSVVTNVIYFALMIVMGLICLPYVATNVTTLYSETKKVEIPK